MSHRSQILFREGELSVLTYKHWGGFPETVIPLLRDYWQWCPRRYIKYLVSTWFYYCKRKMEDEIRDEKYIEPDSSPVETTEIEDFYPVAQNYGICADGSLNWDTEHLYVVDIDEERVSHYTPVDDFLFKTDSLDETTARTPDKTYPLAMEESNQRCVESKQGGKYE